MILEEGKAAKNKQITSLFIRKHIRLFRRPIKKHEYDML